MSTFSHLFLKVAGKRMNANKLVISSQSRVFSNMFSPPPSSYPGSLPRQVTAFNRQESFVSLSFSNPNIFELFLQYLYGAQLSFKTPANQQGPFDSSSSTSNSKTSLDDSIDTTDESGIWNSLYDRFGVEQSSIPEDLDFDGMTTHSGKGLSNSHNTPPKNGISKGDSKTGSEGLSVSYETNNLKEDLGLLRQLAITFKTEELLKRYKLFLSINRRGFCCYKSFFSFYCCC